MSVVFKYLASDKLRNLEFAETGQRGSSSRELTVSPDSLTAEQRQMCVAAVAASEGKGAHAQIGKWANDNLHINLTNTFSPDPTALKSGYNPYKSEKMESDKVLDVETAVALTKNAIDSLIDSDVVLDSLRQQFETAYNQAVALIEDGKVNEAYQFAKENEIANYAPSGRTSINSKVGSIQRAEREEFNRRDKERKEQRKAELDKQKAEWIESNGSDHLREAFSRGYDSQRQYVLERAAQEAPEWQVDFNGTADWDSRSFPSKKALAAEDDAYKLAEKIGGQCTGIVWMKAPPTSSHDQYNDFYDYEQCEGIVINSYLDKYTLVRFVE